MKTSESPSARNDEKQKDWKEVLFEIIIKIITLGFYHIKKHKG